GIRDFHVTGVQTCALPIYDGEVDFEELRHQIGFVTQDTQLFSGTIRENLLFVNPAASDEMILDVIQKASGQTILSRAEKGLETRSEERRVGKECRGEWGPQ